MKKVAAIAHRILLAGVLSKITAAFIPRLFRWSLMNNMKINRLKIVNYKLFQNVTIEMNENINIFVGENDSGKSTILEALSMVLTGKINGSSVANRLNLDWFNAQVRQKFKESIEAGNTPDLPTIEIEVYFASPDEDEIAIKKYSKQPIFISLISLFQHISLVSLTQIFD